MSKPNTSGPLVTVYIPTYNRAVLLKRAVDSVLSQTYSNIELIVVDDNSTDDTHDYLAKMAALDSRFKYFINEKNSGACYSRNKAIFTAKGEFVTGLDDDDYFLPSRIENFVTAALKDGKKAYFSRTIVKDNQHTELRLSYYSILNSLKPKLIRDPKKLLKQNLIGNQIFISTKTFQKSKGFDISLKAWQDLECWYNLIKNQKIEFSLVETPSMVIDVSHSHERITNKNIQNVLDAYEYFSKKHKLNSIEKFILKGQVVPYNPKHFSKVRKISLFLLTRQLFYLKYTFMRDF